MSKIENAAILGGDNPARLGEAILNSTALPCLESLPQSPKIDPDLKNLLSEDALEQISIIEKITEKSGERSLYPGQIEEIQDAWCALEASVKNNPLISEQQHKPALDQYRKELQAFSYLVNEAESRRDWRWATEKIDYLLGTAELELEGYSDTSLADKVAYAKTFLNPASIDEKEKLPNSLKNELKDLAGRIDEMVDKAPLKLPEISIPGKQAGPHLLEGMHLLRTANELGFQVELKVKDGTLELGITREIKSDPGRAARLFGVRPEVLGHSIVRIQLEKISPMLKPQAAGALENFDNRLDEVFEALTAAGQPAIKINNDQAILNTDNSALREHLKVGRLSELSNIIVQHDSLMGLDCRNGKLTEVEFRNSNLAGLNGEGATFKDCKFEGCFAPGMIFDKHTRFKGRNEFIESDLSYTELAGRHDDTLISGCNLHEVKEARQGHWNVRLESKKDKPQEFSYNELRSALNSDKLLVTAAGLYGVKYSPDLVLLTGKQPGQLIRILPGDAGVEISQLTFDESERAVVALEPVLKPLNTTLALLKVISLARIVGPLSPDQVDESSRLHVA